MVVESYCEVNTIAAENEARLVSTNVKVSFCRIVKIIGMEFFNYLGKPINIDLAPRLAGL